ncbi:ABC-type spermidine/putrescine transport system permease subunit I [Rhodoligotrophos appendicifer]|uniref:ABC transporter permease n=1 Tax=Rhodoligotrophos appendicifer TaxID=987056 RepID=UPI00118639FA|nr:ABC transporter permease [Rhodoligotrophos appendicifer]
MSVLIRRHASFLLLLPAILLLAAFFILPTLQLVGLSFEGDAGAMTHYSRIFDRPVYVQVLQRTFLTSAATAVLCVLIGYPVAYRLVTGSNRTRLVLLALILVPFWTNLLVLCYGWLIVLNPQGAVNTLLLDIGLINTPLPLSGGIVAVLIGMVQTMMPYLILPVAANMARIDNRVLQAARSLGAPPLQVFLRAYLPMTLPGVMAGALLVFIMSIGFFIIPAILGGTRDIFIAQLIEMNINKVLNWGFAAALSTIVLVTTLALYAIGVRWFRLGSIWGQA